MPTAAQSQFAAPRQHDAEAAGRAWRLAAWVGGVFTLLVGATLLAGHVRAKAEDPLKSPQLKAYKEELRLHPTDKEMKEKIRQLDLELRRRYFRHLSQMGLGYYLLVSGAVVFVLGVSRGGRGGRRSPTRGPRSKMLEEAARATVRARWSVAGSGMIIGGLLFGLSLGLSTVEPGRLAEVEKLYNASDAGSGEAVRPADQAEAGDAASVEEMRQNWPRFRGADGNGVAMFTNLPTSWDVKTGAGIAWKVAAPARGFGSPIVWGDRVYLSGGNASQREVFCLDGKTGQMVWRQVVANVPGAPAQAAEIPESTGYAASTMATDGRLVYALFANGDCAAFTLEGQAVWSKSFGALKNPYGHACSLATWRDRLIVQLDQGEPEDNKSKLYALEGRSGRIVWQRPRRVGASWATPVVIEAGGRAQVIALAVPWVIAYGATDGAELWRVECLNGEITPSPAFAGGLLFAASPSEKLLAIRPDGQGNVTKSHVVWTAEDNVPDVTSPASNRELVFALTTSGMLTCLDAKYGRKQWDHDFEMDFHASPSLAGERLYLVSQKGTVVVAEAGRQFKELFRTEMGEGVHASPAFAEGRIFLRGVTNVWCLGKVRSPGSEATP